MFKKIRNFFSKIVDHRAIGRTKFKLDDIVAIAFIATMAGCHGWKEIHSFAFRHAYWFKKMLPTLKEIPSVDTLARTISALDTDILCEMMASLAIEFHRHAKRRRPGRRGKNELPDVIGLDGKTARGTIQCQQLKGAMDTRSLKSQEIA